MRKILLTAIAAGTCLLLYPIPSLFAVPEAKKVQAIIDSNTNKEIKVYSFSGDDYFSLKDISSVYGFRTDWKPVSGLVSLFMDNLRLDVSIKNTRVTYNGKTTRISLPTRFDSGELYVPVVFVESSDFNDFSAAQTLWNSETGVLTVDHKMTVAPPRVYVSPGVTRIVIESAEDFPIESTQEEGKQIRLSIARGRIQEGTVNINNGIVTKIEMKNKGRQAFVTVHASTDTTNIERQQVGTKQIIAVYGTLKNVNQLTGISISTSAVSGDEFIATVAPSSASASAASSNGVISSSAAAEPVSSDMSPAEEVSAENEQPPGKEMKVKKIIVLDAGHGGNDPGAVGKKHTKEKDINLAIVQELQHIFENDVEGNWEVVLTRTDDTFIPLVERTSLANEKKADLFVSIHCNADWPHKTAGFEIYFLSEEATDEEAAATAMLENAVVELEGKPSEKRALLQNLLWSLMVNEFINESSELCSFITGEVQHRIKIQDRGVRQAGFYVLRGAEMPAVLVECAFLSNRNEELRLRDRNFQRQMAEAIFDGIRKYFIRKDVANAKSKKDFRNE